jgi:amino acid adenylation domain-containing protein
MTAHDSASRRARLTPEQHALLDRWSLGRTLGENGDGPQTIAPRPPGAVAALSFAQERLWFLDRLTPGNAFYNMDFAWRLHAAVDPDALAWAVERIVDRHEVLRTRFVSEGGRPRQEVLERLDVPVAVDDLRALPRAERDARAIDLATDEARRPFDLAHPPLLRIRLLVLGREETVLLVTMHHIVSDGWSMTVFSREFEQLYRARVSGVEAGLAPLPVQYADYVVWQRAWLADGRLDELLGYWRRRLADLPTLALPTDRPRPAVQRFRGSRLPLSLPAELSGRLAELAARHGATQFMVLLAGFAALLSRYAGQTDIVIGAPIAGRTRPELEPLIGFFVNTLVLRVDLEGHPSGHELVRRTRETCVDAYSHQDVPFERLVEDLHPQRSLARNPLCQVTLQLHNDPHGRAPHGNGAGGAPAPGDDPLARVERATSIFDIAVSLAESADGMWGRIDFDTDLFDPGTVERLGRHLVAVLEGMAAEPDRPVDELDLLDPAERHRVVHAFNGTVTPAPDRLVHEAIAEQAARTPEAIAVTGPEASLTSAELARAARALARELQARGARPDDLVAVCLPRSTALVVALLAVLEAGAAYLPVDPEYPRARRRLLLDEGRPALMIAPHPTDDAPCPVVVLDSHAWAAGGAEPLELDEPVRPEHLAYAIATSGSTGAPKLAANTHRALANHMAWMQRSFGLREDDRVLLKTPASFDASVWEVFWPLLAGARLVVAPPGAHADPAALVALVARERITTLQLVPSQLAMLLDEPGLEGWTALRRLFCGGEALTADLRDRARERIGADIYNLYGPTETCIDATWHPLPREEAGPVVPIGRPIDNVRVHVLDGHGAPCPIGVPGELHIGGAAVGRGYLHRPRQTAERFVDDPFEPGLLYRTGDRGRRRADGALEYLGRLDDQLKLRGFRIEPGEIESELLAHRAVRECAVTVAGAPGEERLVAYVAQADPDGAVAAERLGHEHVAHWRSVYAVTYRDLDATGDPALNTVGWNSSYSGRALPPDEMREWIEATAGRILALRPHRVLELGCGTGMVLARVAPHVERYVGTDLSGDALRYCASLVAADPAGLGHVELLERTADRFDGLDREFDTVVLNSVVQYFPSVAYLLAVLRAAIARMPDGGAVFLGDVRSLPLLGALHTSIELARADGDLGVAELSERVRRRRSHERELVLDPALFADPAAALERVHAVEVRPKRGRHANELNRFRDDVVLRVGPPPDGAATPPSPQARLDWRADGLSVEALRALLAERRPASVLVTGISDARTEADRLACELAGGEEPPATVAELRAAAREQGGHGVDPEALWTLADGLPYDVDVRRVHGAAPGTLALLLRAEGSPPPALPPERPTTRAPAAYANHPLQALFAETLVPDLRDHLAQRLPEHLVPSAFVLVERLPRTPAGKLDRRALPDPTTPRPGLEQPYVPPATETQQALAELWAGVLEIDRVGIGDDFFELGGHSLLGTQLVSRVRERFGIELPLRALFEAPTIAGLAERVETIQWAASGGAGRRDDDDEDTGIL